MALKKVYASLDEIPEALRGSYIEKDGKFVLDLEGDDDKLTGALEKERKRASAAEKALTDLKKQLGDVDPAKAREALKTIAELEEKNLLGEGKFEEAVAKRVERIAADSKAQIEALTGERGKLTSQLEELLIDNSIRSAAAKAGIRSTAVEDAVLYGKQFWRLKDGKPVPMKGEEVLYGKEANKPLTMDEWIAERASDRAHWFEPSTGAGAPPAGGVGRQVGNKVTITPEQAKNVVAYRAAKDAASKAGAELVIQ